MTYLDPELRRDDGMPSRRRTSLILAGGEVLIDGVREELFYPVLGAIRERWGASAPQISIQTTGDVLEPEHVGAMLARGVGTIAIPSIDDFHVGMEGDKKLEFMESIRAMMASFRVKEVDLGGARDPRLKSKAPNGEARRFRRRPVLPLLRRAARPLDRRDLAARPRLAERALQRDIRDELLRTLDRRQSFLNYGQAGSEVAIEPDGSVYPCCLKTKAPLGI